MKKSQQQGVGRLRCCKRHDYTDTITRCLLLLGQDGFPIDFPSPLCLKLVTAGSRVFRVSGFQGFRVFCVLGYCMSLLVTITCRFIPLLVTITWSWSQGRGHKVVVTWSVTCCW